MTDATNPCLDFTNLTRYQPRRFVPDDATLTDKDTVVALYRQLLDRPIESAQELEGWLLDRSELDAAIDQAGSVLYIRMTCQTDDEARAKAYQAFIQDVVPALKPLGNEADRKYLAARERFAGAGGRYAVYDRALRADVELFRPQNVPLQTEDDLLHQKYQEITGAMTVQFEGQERTLPQMGKFLLETDRDLRERAWRATAQRRLQDRQRIEELFDQMLALRGRIARNADCADYRDYAFRARHRFDYTPADCERFHAAVERHVVPLMRTILEQRRRTMGLERLRPWDTAVDPKGRGPLKPFEEPAELVERAREAFTRTDPQLGGQFEEMARLGLLDLASRKGKAPGGYQSTLSEARKPFIFMNAVGVDGDVRTLLHEGGHAFHALASAAEPLAAYRDPPIEFAEVASMGMELLAGEHLDVFYQGEDLTRSRREHFEGVLTILPWVATIDAFQHWLYTHPGHSADQRRQAWLEVRQRFGGGVVDWSELETEHAYLWHRQLHIFLYPFYYIEYGIAQLGALQVWVRAKRVGRAALEDYRAALALGGSRPLPELFTAAGLKFDFSEKTIAPLAEAVEEEIRRLPA